MIYSSPCTMLLILMLLPNTPPMLSSCCFLPFCPSPYHSPDPYQEEKEKLFRLLFLTTYCLLKLPILEKPSMLLVLVMIYWLTGRYCWGFFSSKDVQFARVILLRTRIVIVQDIQVKTLIAKFIPSRYYIFISIVIVKRVAALFLPMPDWKGGNIAQTFLCTNFLYVRLY